MTETKVVVRDSEGLRNALFDELDGLRAGTTTPSQAIAVAKLASQIVGTINMEINYHRFRAKHAEAPAIPGKPITLKLGS